MFNVGGAELLVVMVVALFAVGPDKLPAAVRKIGQTRAQLQDWSGSIRRELRAAIEEEPQK